MNLQQKFLFILKRSVVICLLGCLVNLFLPTSAHARTEQVTVVYHQGETVWREQVASFVGGDTPNLAMRSLSMVSGYAIDYDSETGGVVWDSPFGLCLFHPAIQGVYIAEPAPTTPDGEKLPLGEEKTETTPNDPAQLEQQETQATLTPIGEKRSNLEPQVQIGEHIYPIGIPLPENEKVLWLPVAEMQSTDLAGNKATVPEEEAPAANQNQIQNTSPLQEKPATVVGWQTIHSEWPEAILMEDGAAYIPMNMIPFLGMDAQYDAGQEELHVYLAAGIPPSGVPYRALQDLSPLLKADLAKLPKQIATFTTQFNPNEKNRTVNLKLACAAINNYELKPGDIFSFNKVVGVRTPEKGYLPATIFVGQKMVDDYGGGICQVSSTLYNTAANAGLLVLERHSHSLPVSYVKKGRDATVAYGSLDFRFQNDTEKTLQIRVEVGSNTLTISLWQYA